MPSKEGAAGTRAEIRSRKWRMRLLLRSSCPGERLHRDDLPPECRARPCMADFISVDPTKLRLAHDRELVRDCISFEARISGDPVAVTVGSNALVQCPLQPGEVARAVVCGVWSVTVLPTATVTTTHFARYPTSPTAGSSASARWSSDLRRVVEGEQDFLPARQPGPNGCVGFQMRAVPPERREGSERRGGRRRAQRRRFRLGLAA